uniref:Secreted protein n=1 Tax=Ixodes ricinus TaxID=34613 RepID=A0A147BQD6_IXORI
MKTKCALRLQELFLLLQRGLLTALLQSDSDQSHHRTRSLLLFKCAAWTEQGYCCSFASPRKRIIQRSAAQRERSSRVEFLSLAGAQVCGVWLQSYCDTYIPKPPTALLTQPRLKKKARAYAVFVWTNVERNGIQPRRSEVRPGCL